MGEDSPLPYKSCRDFELRLKVGEELRFQLGGHGAGIFVLHAVPHDDAVMLLTMLRHDTVSTAVSFESHLFAKRPEAQVALIDAYRGPSRASATLLDEHANSDGSVE